MSEILLDGIKLAEKTGTSNITLANSVLLNSEMTIPSDLVQLSANTPFPGNHVFQVTNKRQVMRTALGNETINFFNHSITLLKANSNIYVDFGTSVGGFDGYRDTDLAAAIAWKTGSSSTTSGDYNKVHGDDTTLLARQQVGNLGAYYVTDTSPVGGSGGQYWHHIGFGWRGDIELGSQSAGTVINVAAWFSSDGNADNYVLGGPDSGSTTDSGLETFMNVWEISTS